MVDIVPGVTLAAALSGFGGVVSGWVSLVVYRSTDSRSDDGTSDLVRPFLGLSIVFTVCALLFAVFVDRLSNKAVAGIPVLLIVLLAVPWTVFALRYAGRGHLITRRRVATAVLFAVVLAVLFVLRGSGALPDGLDSVVSPAISVLLLIVLAAAFVAGGFVALSTRRHGSMPLTSGLLVVLPMGELLVVAQVINFVDVAGIELLVGVTFLGVALVFPVAVKRYDVLTARPGTGTLGERTVVDTMNEAFLVVERTGDIVRSNQQAKRLFGADVDGQSLGDVLEFDVTELHENDTVDHWSAEGHRRFDPRVSTLTDDRGHVLGHTITLLDVTDREIRRQRIQVLNRILRHNIRNELSAIEARAELALDDNRSTDEHVGTILDITDDLETLSAEARRIEKLMRGSRNKSMETELDTFVQSVVESTTSGGFDGTLTVDVPRIVLSVDRGLLRYAVQNLVENAIEHNDAADPRVEIRGTETTDGVCLVVADNGPGIPEAERAVIESGGEDPHAHATSLGLWGTSWAVQTMGGDLSFGESGLGGAAVTIDLPITTGEVTDIRTESTDS